MAAEATMAKMGLPLTMRNVAAPNARIASRQFLDRCAAKGHYGVRHQRDHDHMQPMERRCDGGDATTGLVDGGKTPA